MSKAIVIPFYRYHPRIGEYYKVYFETLLNGLKIWGDEFDKLYLIDQEWGFTQNDRDKLQNIKPDSEILVSPVTGHHWEQFKWAIPQIKEDTILFLDNDVVIWKKGVIDNWFKRAENSGIVSAFDGSGGLKNIVHENFKSMKIMDATRMGSYYFILHKDIFDKIPDFDFSPITYPIGTYIKELDYTTQEGDWSDSFGLFTIKLLALNPTINVIIDDRSSISLSKDGIIKTTEEPLQLGYYHVRNGNLPVYTLASKASPEHYQDYTRTLQITPFTEFTRLFAWFDILTNHKWGEIDSVLMDLGIGINEWKSYVEEVKKYHGYD
ncbi:MAG TPA: hypothetical protein VF820_03205 [Patescibacteria group bacterium]